MTAPDTFDAYRGDLLDLGADPAADDGAVRFRPDGWLLVRGQRIAGVLDADAEPDPRWRRHDWRGHLLLPGFVDTHVHAPQLDVIASYGTELLDWLQSYTFPAEARWADPAHARRSARRFVRELLAHGTTCAMVFPTVHRAGVDALFEAAVELDMALLGGRVLMDRNCPDALRDDARTAERETVELIERWHGRGRCGYALTPRFAATSSAAQLELCGALLRAYDGVHLQTHLAENRAEVDWIRALFPDARSYLDVYARAGLLGPRSVFAHAIWLDADDRAQLAASGSAVAFSPSSNLFLGSGLFDWAATAAAGVPVAIASDVGAGTSLCQLRSAADAYKVLALQGQRLDAWRALHAITRGAARTLRRDDLGHFDVGAWADFCVWSWSADSLQRHRVELARSLHERVFAWLMLADSRNLAAVHVAGRRVPLDAPGFAGALASDAA
jgi:guanine deaminase